MADYVAKYRLLFDDMASRGLLRAAGAARGLSRSLSRAATGLSVAAAGALAAGTLVNNITAERERLAQSVQVSQAQLGAIGTIAQKAGLNFENVVDLAEEMNNKIGEMRNLGELTSLEEGLEGLKLQFSEIRDLSPEDQFQRIFDAAMRLGDVQIASSSLDMILGGEASKLAGLLARELDRLGLTYGEFVERQKSLNNLTAEGIAGAVAYTDSVSELSRFFTTLSSDVFGRLGGALAPVIDRLNEFLISNKAIIATGIAEYVDRFSDFFADIDFASVVADVQAFADGVGEVVAKIGDLVDLAGGVENFALLLGGIWVVGKVVAFGAALATLATALGISAALFLGLTAIAGVAAAIYLNWDKIKEAAGSAIDYILEKIQPLIDAYNKLKEAISDAFDFGSPEELAARAGANPRRRGAAEVLDEATSARRDVIEVEARIEVTGEVSGANVETNVVDQAIRGSGGDTRPVRTRGRR